MLPFTFHTLKPNHLTMGPKGLEMKEETQEEVKAPAPQAKGKGKGNQSTACVIL